MKFKSFSAVFSLIIFAFFAIFAGGCSQQSSGEIVLRISNWEEYIDLGDWDEEETIILSDGTEIFGENNMVEDFEDWYYETYGQRVRVEYSTFGTNEEMINQIKMGDMFDLVCPSEYAIMKMHREGLLEPYSEEFFDETNEENHYIRGVSPYILETNSGLDIGGENFNDYAAGYMWGTLGLVYNTEEVTEEEARHWSLLNNRDHYKNVTIKDSVRDAYIAATAMVFYDEITDPEFKEDPDYKLNLSNCLNRTDPETVKKVEEMLSEIKDNVYSFETDSGKADVATGKIYANEQWSGDAVYTMDIGDEEGYDLAYSVPEEGSNMWFDGWVMLKDGINGDPQKKQAAEAFVNFVSRPDNAIRNMYYIGYTSVISGGEDTAIYDYLKYRYEAEDDEEDTIQYPVGYFFTDNEDEKDEYIVTAPADQGKKQLFAQYPTEDIMERSVVMYCFSEQEEEDIGMMWVNVRCFSL